MSILAPLTTLFSIVLGAKGVVSVSVSSLIAAVAIIFEVIIVLFKKEYTILQTVINQFSDGQKIIVAPPSLGGIDRLNLDNIATLKLDVPYGSDSITLRLDVVTKELSVKTSPEILIEQAELFYHGNSGSYFFDIKSSFKHTIEIEGKKFVVKLLSIKNINIPDVPNAKEYSFSIREIV